MVNVGLTKEPMIVGCESCFSAPNYIKIKTGKSEYPSHIVTLCEACAEKLMNEIRHILSEHENSED